MTPLAPLVTAFFRNNLVADKGVSKNTLASYSYSFKFLCRYVSSRCGRTPVDGQGLPRIFGHGRSAALSGIHRGPSAAAYQVLDQGGDESGRCGGIIRGVPWRRGSFSMYGRDWGSLA